MISKKINLTILLCLFVTTLYTQEFELGKVSIAELQEKAHPVDSSASAAILYKKGTTCFQSNMEGYWQVVHETEYKIKIYKKDGYDYAKHEEFYNSEPGRDKLYYTNVCTYNLVNGKIEKTKIKSEGEIIERINKTYSNKKIVLPNVKVGSIVEFKVRQETFNTVNLVNFNFQYDIPMNYMEYVVSYPERYEYNRTLYGYLKPEQNLEKLQLTNRNYNLLKQTYILKNVNAMREESYVSNINNYRSRIRYELASYKDDTDKPHHFAYDWESVTKKIYQEDDFGKELKKDNYFEEDLNELLKEVTSEEEKILKIFEYVKNRVKWDESNGILCDKGVKEAYKTRSGNVAEINLMLTAMLRFAKIDANPILVSTESNGISNFSSRTAFNYVIVGVKIGGDTWLLDATDKYSLPNILPLRALNWGGRLIRKDETSEEVDLMPKSNSKDQVALTATISAEGIVKGQYKRQLTDYNAFNYRHNYASLTVDSHIEKIENMNGGIEILDLVVENKMDLSKPIIESYTFTDDKHVEVINDKIYFSPMLFDAITENPFKSEKREYPIDYSFPYTDKYILNYTLPNGYEIESMPAPINMKLGDNLGAFKCLLNKGENSIQVIVQFDINTPIISPEYYEDIKVFYQKMLEKQQQKIVLIRK